MDDQPLFSAAGPALKGSFVGAWEDEVSSFGRTGVGIGWQGTGQPFGTELCGWESELRIL